MAHLFHRTSAVTSIPGKDDVDPDLLGNPSRQPDADQKDYRTTNSGESMGALRYSSVEPLSLSAYVDPEGPEWPTFLEKLRALVREHPVTLTTQDGRILTVPQGGEPGDGNSVVYLHELQHAADHGFPPMALTDPDA